MTGFQPPSAGGAKRYLLTTPSGKKWKRKLNEAEVAQFRQAGFIVEEIVEPTVVPNRKDIRRQGLYDGKWRMPRRTPKKGKGNGNRGD